MGETTRATQSPATDDEERRARGRSKSWKGGLETPHRRQTPAPLSSQDGPYGLRIDAGAPHSPKLAMALGMWRARLDMLAAGEMTREEYDDWRSSF